MKKEIVFNVYAKGGLKEVSSQRWEKEKLNGKRLYILFNQEVYSLIDSNDLETLLDLADKSFLTLVRNHGVTFIPHTFLKITCNLKGE